VVRTVCAVGGSMFGRTDEMIRITKNGVSIEGKEIPLYSGAVHYWRIAREHWEDVLDCVKEMGFRIVETYIPWSVHEYEEGKYDFGDVVPEKDLDCFLSVCEQKGLKILVRPGPHINAEMTDFGFPEWILGDDEIQARSPMGTGVVYPFVAGPFPIPSYASKKLFQKFTVYFERILPILKKHDYPDGGIIGIQADNEMCYFFRDSAYTLDYCGDAIRQYRDMLSMKYKGIAQLNKVYHSTYSGYDDICPPTQFGAKKKEDLPYYLDWAEYKEYQILKGLAFYAGLIKKSKMNAFVFHNCAYQNYTPISLQRSEAIPGMDLVGIDAYPEGWDLAVLRERIRYMASGSILPFVPEFGCGSYFDRGYALSADQEEYGYLYAFMNGMKAVNFYMLADRDRWFACPVTNDGKKREPYYSMLQGIMNMLHTSGLAEYHRKPDVLIYKNYGMGRLKQIYALFDPNQLQSNCLMQGPEFPRELFQPDIDLGITMDADLTHWGKEVWIDMVCNYLLKRGIDYNISDQYLSEEALMEYPVVVASMYDFLDEKEAVKLDAYARNGGMLIVGPKLPVYNQFYQKYDMDTSHWHYVKDIDALAGIIPEYKPLYWLEDPEIEITVHRKSEQEILFMANTSGKDKIVTMFFEGNAAFYGLWKASDSIADNKLAIEIRAHTIYIWKVVRGRS